MTDDDFLLLQDRKINSFHAVGHVWTLSSDKTPSLCFFEASGENISIFSSTQTTIPLNINTLFMASLHRTFKQILQELFFPPQNIQRMMIVFGSGFYESRSNQIRSLFGLAPSSEYKQRVLHIYSQSLETMRPGLKRAHIMKNRIFRRSFETRLMMWMSCGLQLCFYHIPCRFHSSLLPKSPCKTLN